MVYDSMIVNIKGKQELRHEEVGNKSFRLHQLYEMGYCISDGYVLNSRFFEDYCKYNRIICSSDSFKNLEEQIQHGRFREESETILKKIYDELISQTGSLIVRSSGVKEDGFDKTYAGVFESITDVLSFTTLLQAVKKVWSSFFTDLASCYSENNGIEGIAVLIQVMIPCDKSGIAFSRNPLNNVKEIIVEVCAGNNDKIISGCETAQKYILSEMDQDIQNTPLMTTDELKKLKHIILSLESSFHFPCDVEWGIQGKELYLFQLRPVILHAQNNIYTEPLREYEECVLLDRYSNPATVCYLSILDSWQKNVYISLYEDKKCAQVSELPLCFLQNRVYWNMQYQKKYFHDESDGSPSNKMLFEQKLKDGYSSWYRRLDSYLEKIQVFDQEIIKTNSAKELVLCLENIMDNFCVYLGVDHFRFLGFAQVLYKRLREQYEDDPEKLEQALKLVGEYSNENETVKANEELALLGEIIKNQESLKILFETEEEETILAKIKAEDYAQFYGQFEQFVEKRGHRGIDCDDLYYPHWKECPEKIIKLLKNLIGCEKCPEGEVVLKPNAEKMKTENKTIRIAGIYMSLRENQRYYFDMSWVLIRKLLLKLGEYYQKNGITKEPQDIFHLTIQEIKDGVLLDKGYITSNVVKKRKANFHMMENITPTYVIKDAQEIMIQTNKRCTSYKCTGLSVGAASGKAVIIQDMEALAKIRQGDIAVVSTFHPSWTPVLSKVAGMIMNYGNMLSHGAVVAREYGIPVVVFNGDATKILHDGERVELNGTTGRVRINKDSI